MSSLIAGYLLLLGLIVAIGAQNVLVLRQGLRREHVGLVVALCAGSDALLITVGALGAGSVVTSHPDLMAAARFAGAAFLLGYAALAARRALSSTSSGLVVEPDATTGHNGSTGATTVVTTVARTSATSIAVTTLALTYLNPHVYLDTVLLMGSAASTHGDGRWWFALGGALASLSWFVTIGYGARLLAPVLSTARAWRALDSVIAVVMVAMAWRLAAG